MNVLLEQLAARYGIEPDYVSETGEYRVIADVPKRGILHALGVDAGDQLEMQRSLQAAPPLPASSTTTPARCFLPVDGRRMWGVSCQLYGLRSERNQGVGDFEDLARLVEALAPLGADFVGVNPLHALFSADPRRISPYAPSSRRFLNPLYIAVDRLAEELGCVVPGGFDPRSLRTAELVDYPAVAAAKLDALRRLHEDFEMTRGEGPLGAACDAFLTAGASDLAQFALFEALSEVMAAQGLGSGWFAWPERLRTPASQEIAEFGRRHAHSVRFHAWLQWCADRQLGAAQRRAREAGMTIGLYADLAVGVAPDGAATWSCPDSVVAGVRVGAPPDRFNARGQDWGLAPLSPVAMRADGAELFAAEIAAAMRHAGALRIDHAMALQHLYWIPRDADAAGGAYVSYPTALLLERLAAASHSHRALVIGEDLGTVPDGFRELMREAGVLSYRVAWFERDEAGAFLPSAAYPTEAMACVSTHDLPTLAGWWQGHDIALRRDAGMIDASEDGRQRIERAHDRLRLVDRLACDGELSGAAAAEARTATFLPEAVSLGLHVMLARAPSRLLAVQLEDLLGTVQQANLPGTIDEHPNWRRRLGPYVEDMAGHAGLRRLAAAIAAERP